MPTYEYLCDACGHEFEQFQSITAGALKKCPSCGKNKLRRLISSGAGLIFKGSGFYITDYRSDGYKEKAKAESGEKPASNNGKPESTTKPETKPAKAEKAESKSPAKKS